MTGVSSRIAIVFGALAVGVGIVGICSRTDPRGALPLPPAVGRSAKEVAAGVDPRFGHLAPAIPDVLFKQRTAVRRLEKRLKGVAGPPGATRALLYPFMGDLPPSDLEEGPPWHIVLELDGGIALTARLSRGLPAVPPGMPTAVRLAWHVAVPFALRFTPEREEALRALLVYLGGRFAGGAGAVALADTVPGARFQVGAGLDRRRYEPPLDR